MSEKMFNEDFFKKLNKINMYINFKLSGGTQGGRKSKAKGVSVEFSDYREYAPGDDFRRIDWNAYGRFDKFFIKVFMEEREGVFNFFIDKSKSMDYGKDNKKNTALKIVAALSYIALNNLDRVNISTMNDGSLENIKTSTGNRGFQKILMDLEKIKFDGTTDLSSSIKKRPLSMRGISIVVSDFLNNEGLESLEDGLKYLAYKKQEIILVQVLCDEEINPDFNNEITLIDSETGENIKLSVTPALINEYKETLKIYNEKVEALAKKYGGKLISVNSSMNIEEIILSEFSKRKVLY
ncbi:DUF58 domain-containing protein [Clostridium celatum]|uniref:DUF58 domain-containing protein n=1 Tax=Clostridium celatum TaxID=36834 RepID=UPI0018999659|nr:DUF58 domain-containing protein [Clostridium celatum]MDU2265364.1 DUF58 domain-containing protein [Clostridium celatum]MDU3722921.1 DUF58 domain-containing protein [Clostridium celatum]MDU6294996.1 DUF58 domain-containing protein [Clostridium celatum]MDY3361489.1 DUF58 domain-containing protein [Clostridium celatum]